MSILWLKLAFELLTVVVGSWKSKTTTTAQGGWKLCLSGVSSLLIGAMKQCESITQKIEENRLSNNPVLLNTVLSAVNIDLSSLRQLEESEESSGVYKNMSKPNIALRMETRCNEAYMCATFIG